MEHLYHTLPEAQRRLNESQDREDQSKVMSYGWAHCTGNCIAACGLCGYQARKWCTDVQTKHPSPAGRW